MGSRRGFGVKEVSRGLTLEPPITPISELYAERGWEPASEEAVRRLTADDASADGEGWQAPGRALIIGTA